jgi:signal peptidase I
MGLLEKLSRWNKGRERISNSQLPTVIREILSIVKFLFFNIFLTYLVFLQLFLSYSIVISGSLTPTCHTNDIIIVSTIKYGLKSKGTDMMKKLMFGSTRSQNSFFKPQRGDIVAFQSREKSVIYQKRVLGVPGDRIQFKNGMLHINDVVCPLKYLGQTRFVENDKEYFGFLYEETMPNNQKYNVIYQSDPGEGNLDNTEIFIVPEGNYFMVGDNRQNSDDSRSLIGFVPEENIIGRAIFTLFSNSNLRTLNPISFVKGIKLNRWFKWIE